MKFSDDILETSVWKRIGNLTLFLSACGGGGSADIGGISLPPPPPPANNPAIELTQVFGRVSFYGLLKLLQAPGDSTRWFAVEQRGMVWVFDNDPNVSSPTLFIDISARVDSGPNEAGLLGMAFHPDWGINGNFEVFLSYTRVGSPLESVVSRFFSQDNGATLDNGIEDVIMTVLQDFGNHNGGNIEFGPDGNLYAGWGDGGNGGDPRDNAQNTSREWDCFWPYISKSYRGARCLICSTVHNRA